MKTIGYILLVAIAVMTSYGARQLWDARGSLLSKTPILVTAKASPKPRAPLLTVDDLVTKYAKHYVLPKPLIWAIIDTESKGNPKAVRHEDGYLKRIPKEIKNETERYMWASSYGLMQVMAFPHAYQRKMHWSELLDPETNIRVGSEILFKCYSASSSKGGFVAHTRRALGCYNGDPIVYPDMILEKVGEWALALNEK
jgi:hypothetical protein